MSLQPILPGVYHLKQDLAPVFPGSKASICLLVGERIAVIDTGLPGGEALVWEALKSIGRPPADVVAIVNTHVHGDHTGSNGPLRARTGAQIMIHTLDAPRLGTGELEGPSAGPADRLLEDGERIDLGGLELQVVHLPGHTPGSIGVHLPAYRALFTGDSLQARGTRTTRIAAYGDPVAYVHSVHRAMQLGIEHLIPGHAFRPFTDSYLVGDAVRQFLDVSLEHARELDEAILDALRERQAGLDVRGIAEHVCARYAPDAGDAAVSTIGGHLRQLMERGVVTADGGDRAATYRLAA